MNMRKGLILTPQACKFNSFCFQLHCFSVYGEKVRSSLFLTLVLSNLSVHGSPLLEIQKITRGWLEQRHNSCTPWVGAIWNMGAEAPSAGKMGDTGGQCVPQFFADHEGPSWGSSFLPLKEHNQLVWCKHFTARKVDQTILYWRSLLISFVIDQ